jgi:hypothetical protein
MGWEKGQPASIGEGQRSLPPSDLHFPTNICLYDHSMDSTVGPKNRADGRKSLRQQALLTLKAPKPTDCHRWGLQPSQ